MATENSKSPIPQNPSSGSSSSVFPPNSSFKVKLTPIATKLDRTNYFFWRSQVLSSVRANDLEDFLFGTRLKPDRIVPSSASSSSQNQDVMINPEYVLWHRVDQHLLSWLFASVSENISGIVARCTASHEVWSKLESLFATSLKARVLQLQQQLQMSKKGSLSIEDYMLKMRSIVDRLSTAGEKVSDSQLLLYILGGLGLEYDAAVVNLTSRIDLVSMEEAQFLLQNQELRIEQHNSSNSLEVLSHTANTVSFNRNGNRGGNNQGNKY